MAVLLFLCTFNVFADIMALLLPLDMLRDQIPLVFHSFIYHGLIISDAVIAGHILKNRSKYSFKNCVILFFITAFIAQVINISAHYLINDIYREPNMFYINPFMPTKQPVFAYIAENYGIITENIIYIICLIVSSYLLYRFEKKYILNRK